MIGAAPSMWGTGVAARIMEQAERFFRDGGAGRYFVDTHDQNERAQRLYRKFGFDRVGRIAGNVVFRKTMRATTEG